MKTRRLRYFFKILPIIGFVLCSNLMAISTWEKYEKSFTTSKTYSTPMKDVDLSITFNGPGGKSFTLPGFWDGDKTFKMRTTFPSSGKWTYKTTSNDADINNQTGEVIVTDYSGNNVLYKKGGFLKVSSNKRYLTYDDGTPFQWLGCTAWRAPMAATMNEWKEYINDRVSKKFSVVHMSSYLQYGMTTEPTDRNGEKPFINNDYARPNVKFWQGVDEKVDYANSQGMVVLFVGIPGWQYEINDQSTRDKFVRFFVGRFYGNHLIFSPSADQYYTSHNDYVGKEVDKLTDRHLITQHPGTSPSTAAEYYGKSYMDFSGNQSGHQNGNRNKTIEMAIKWNLALYNIEPHKPVINLEAFYHGYENSGSAKYSGTDKDTRGLGWTSWLSGSMGYSYGSLGGWAWGLTLEGNTMTYKQAINLNSGPQMKYMYEFFDAVDWFKLEPKHDKIKNNSSEWTKKMTYAVASDGSFSVAYLRDNSSIKLDLSGISGSITGKWYNPRSGQYSSISGNFANNSISEFQTPGSGDWVLLLSTKPSSGYLTPSMNEVNFSSGAGKQSIAISSNLKWTLSESLSWLTLDKTSGTANGNIELSVTANDGSVSRSGELKLSASGVNDVTIKVSQLSSSCKKYTLTVIQGTGSGMYCEGEEVEIMANIIPNKKFDKWSGDVSKISDVNASKTTVTMPATSINITANYTLVTNIEEFNTSIEISPNPAYNKLNIKNLLSGGTVHIINTLGKVVLEKNQLKEGTTTLDIHELSSGVYVLNISLNNNNTISKRFIKN